MNRSLLYLLFAIPALFFSCAEKEPATSSPKKSDSNLEPPPNVKHDAKASPVMHRIQAGEPEPDGWCLAEPTQGNFSVMLPGKFVDTMLEMATLTGGTARMHTVMTTTADGIEFNVLQTEIIGKRPPGKAEDLMQERFKELGATVKREKIVLGGEYPAVRLDVSAKGVEALMVLLTVANSDYMIAAQSRFQPIDRKKFKASAERFFQSFRIQPGE